MTPDELVDLSGAVNAAQRVLPTTGRMPTECLPDTPPA
jgi:hypothetical protein